jgi:hypothetical protein
MSVVYDVPSISNPGLREIECGIYTLVRYTKPLKDPSLAKYRSVVYKGDKLVAFSPPRSLPMEQFKHVCPTLENAVVCEFVDGMMIYVWHDSESWKTSTRTCLEGEKIFRRGVEPVPKLQEKSDPVIVSTPNELFLKYTSQFSTPFFDLLDKSCTYVFTLMDPSSFNVVKSNTQVCYLTNVYKILDDNKVVSVHLDSVLPLLPVKAIPLQHFQEYSDIENDLSQRSYSTKGFMLYDPVSEARLKILNPAYLKVHDLLSSKPNFNEIVLESIVVHENSHEIATLHDDFGKNIEAIERNILRCANLLYSSYLECFVKKTKAHKDFPVLYRTHMYELHKMYLQSFRALGFRMNKTIVLDYVKKIPVPILVPLLGIY